VLDYWLVVKAQLYRVAGDVPLEEVGWAIRLGDGLAFAPPGLPRVEGLAPVPFRFYRCADGREVRLMAGDTLAFATGECGAWEALPGGDGYVVVEWSPSYEPEEAEILAPDMFTALHVLRSVERRRLDALRSAIEEALAAASRDPGSADRAFKEAIRSYFSTPLRIGGGRLPRPGVEECSTVRACRELVETLRELEEALGVEGVRLAVHPKSLVGEVAEAYYAVWGDQLKVRHVSLSHVARLAEERMWGKLMDMGFIVGVARRGRAAERAALALKDYPYHKIFVVKI
jgi:hypothetical protein